MGQRIAGLCTINADGISLAVQGSVEVPASPVVRETMMALGGAAGYSEKANRPYVKVTALNTVDFPRATLVAMTNAVINAQLANGTTYTLTGAWLEGDVSVNATDGTVDLEFSGLSGFWQ